MVKNHFKILRPKEKRRVAGLASTIAANGEDDPMSQTPLIMNPRDDLTVTSKAPAFACHPCTKERRRRVWQGNATGCRGKARAWVVGVMCGEGGDVAGRDPVARRVRSSCYRSVTPRILVFLTTPSSRSFIPLLHGSLVSISFPQVWCAARCSPSWGCFCW